jgi:hypothetical protein
MKKLIKISLLYTLTALGNLHASDLVSQIQGMATPLRKPLSQAQVSQVLNKTGNILATLKTITSSHDPRLNTTSSYAIGQWDLVSPTKSPGAATFGPYFYNSPGAIPVSNVTPLIAAILFDATLASYTNSSGATYTPNQDTFGVIAKIASLKPDSINHAMTISWIDTTSGQQKTVELTAIMLATYFNNIPAVSALLAAGADIQPNSAGFTPLVCALMNANYNLVQQYIQAIGNNINDNSLNSVFTANFSTGNIVPGTSLPAIDNWTQVTPVMFATLNFYYALLNVFAQNGQSFNVAMPFNYPANPCFAQEQDGLLYSLEYISNIAGQAPASFGHQATGSTTYGTSTTTALNFLQNTLMPYYQQFTFSDGPMTQSILNQFFGGIIYNLKK